MENKNTGLIVLIVVLSLLVLGLGGFIFYDKVLSTPNTPIDNKPNEDDSIDIDNNINKKYSVGDEITFNDEKWNVIKESTENDDYVVVLKSTILNELNEKPYYECPAEDDNGLNCNMKMSNDYKDSVAKKYFEENYISHLGKENLKEVNNYYVRLITIEELRELGCDTNNKCDKAPTWLLSDSVSWTMSYASDAPTMDAVKANVYAFGLDSYNENSDIQTFGVGSTLNVRPVINLLKSSIK